MIKNFKISTWLLFAFSIILLLVFMLGFSSYTQTNLLSEQTEIMYQHPLKVRRSIDSLRLDIVELRLELRNYLLAENDVDKDDALLHMEFAYLDVQEQINIIKEGYLGPKNDIVNISNAFIIWKDIKTTNLELADSGKINEVLISIGPDGEETEKFNILLTEINVIDTYAQNKADELYENSLELHDDITFQLIIMVVSIFGLTMIIGFWLYKNFKNPLAEMNETVIEFQSGNMDRRVTQVSTNELGNLASSINEMADVIEYNANLNNEISEFSDVLISENNEKSFFNLTLSSLLKHTNSVSAAVFLLNEDNNKFECIESIGFERENLRSFYADTKDGEFGKVLDSKEIVYTNLTVENTQYTYNTVVAGLMPKQIVNIPLISGSIVNGIVTLSSLTNFDKKSKEFIDRIADTLTYRSEAILANILITNFVNELETRSNELSSQNSELELQKQQLKEASQMKTDFLSNMSHELRTPLNSVIALSGVLYDRLKGIISEDEFSYLEIIGRNGRNLLDLINDILDISRVESGKIDFEYSTFHVNDCIEDILSMFSFQANEKGIDLKLVNLGENVLLTSDLSKCKHVIQNLISNAVKFTDKGEVVIKVEDFDEHIKINVIDTGIGIETENLDKIFEEFTQEESGTSRRFGGTGLGLSIVQKYSELIGGTISVESTKGKGSIFTLTLPKKATRDFIDDNLEHDFYVPLVNDPFDVSNIAEFDKKILLIEDNESAIIQIKELVKGMGIEIMVAENGEDGIEFLNNHKVDAVILDIMMPGINGFDVLQKIRNNDEISNVPVLVLTAKQITKSELSLLKRNNVVQLIQKGDVDRIKLQKTIFNMLFSNNNIKKVKQITFPIESKILIIEDNLDNIVTLKALLKEYTNIHEAHDGLDALDKIKEIKPDLILMDLGIPKLSGEELFKEIKKDKQINNIPIIAITASALKKERKRILSLGFDDFVSKPIITEELYKAINGVYLK